MVTYAAAFIAAALRPAVVAVAPGTRTGDGIRDALRRGQYPWYDPKTEGFKPLWPPALDFLEWLDRHFGWIPRLVPGAWPVQGLLLLFFAVVATLLFMLWRHSRQFVGFENSRAAVPRAAAVTIRGLPAGVSLATADPWAEALRCREQGDYARAVICLFAHQLLMLERLRVLRLVPGRTGRQLVRAIDDRQYHGWVAPTLRLFEAVYYGRHVPSASEFESVWSLAQEFEQRAGREAVV